MKRRDFIRQAAAISAVSASGNAQQQPAIAAPKPQATERFIGIQMGPHSLLDEGIDRCLDLIQETAAVNAVFVYSQPYHMEMPRPLRTAAQHHGAPWKVMAGRHLPLSS